jgi:predicted ATPase
MHRKQGSIVFISGEIGYGKTTLMRQFQQEAQIHGDTALIALAACQAPVGSMQVGALQPLGPFVRLMEELSNSESMLTPEKRLALNVGMTLLASVPLVGEVFYAAKEISRDLREFRKEKAVGDAAEKDKKQNNQLHIQFLNKLTEWSARHPLILMLDDMHWCDGESALLLEELAERIASLPILVIISYRAGIAEEILSPLLSVLRACPHNAQQFQHMQLGALDMHSIHALCMRMLAGYEKNNEFEKTLLERTGGIPGILSEYLRYFQRVSPFAPDGSIRQEFIKGELLPSSVHAAFGKVVENLAEEEIALLTLCAAEGPEFSAFMIARLLNTDVVSAIRRIKKLQSKTGIIRSLGAHERYGVRTTLYEFNQAMYREHFERTLEFEEKTAIHTQIAAVLQEQGTMYDEQEKARLAPYIAAHAAEAGNTAQARDYLLDTAQSAKISGLQAILESAVRQFDALNVQPEQNNIQQQEIRRQYSTQAEETGAEQPSNLHPLREAALHTQVYPDISATQREILALCDNQMLEQAAALARDFLSVNQEALRPSDEAMLCILCARILLDCNQNAPATEYANRATALLAEQDEPISKCLLHNTLATLAMYAANSAQAWLELQKAAYIAATLSREYQLLTITNISILLSQNHQPAEAARYRKAAKALAKALRFPRFLEQFNRITQQY